MEEWPSETRFLETYSAPEYVEPSFGSKVTDFFKGIAGYAVEAAGQVIPKIVGAVYQSPAAPQIQQAEAPPETRYIGVYQQQKGVGVYQPITKGGMTAQTTGFDIGNIFKSPIILIVLGVGLLFVFLSQRR